ncbi:MAG: amidase, partial [Moraxella sp.]
MSELHTFSVAQLAAGLKNKDFSSTELTQHFLNRIAKHDKAINSFITVTPEQALAQAAAADKLLAEGKGADLTGVPLAHKDIFCTQGVLTTCGSKMLENFVAPYNATIVENCQNVGLVMLGKTSMDEFAMGSDNESSYFGAVHNPWDISRVPGGSSGGSAAAVAAGFAPFATGSDTGGSIRQPASFCGLTGIKPTYGRVSRYGMVAYASSFDQAGSFGKTAEDCAYLLSVLSGHDS